MSAIVGEAFPSRIRAVEALSRQEISSQELRDCAVEAVAFAERFGRSVGAKDWHALALALETAAFLVDWSVAVESAEADADRHLRAARQRLKQFAIEDEPGDYHLAVAACLAPIKEPCEPEDVIPLCARIAALPMAVSIITDPKPALRAALDELVVPKRDELAVAFLEFTINEQPASNLHTLRAKEVHDLGLVIRVSRWPDQAETLQIAPVSVDPASVWDLPQFTFEEPRGEPPYTFQRNGRMIVHASQGFDARPLEFRYAAQFHPAVKAEKVVVAGQRTLRLDGIGPEGRAVSGYGELDPGILAVRRLLRADPMIPEHDIGAVMTLLPRLANLAGASVQDELYPDPIDEKAFEIDLRDRLRAESAIGAELEQQAHAAGGRTDLSFRGIRIELKSERGKRLLPDDCLKYVAQAATYAVGTGKRVAVLAVLDCSPKKTTPLPLASCLFSHRHETGSGIVQVVVVLIQGGFPKPSTFSK